MVIASSLVYICLVVLFASHLVKNFEPEVERSSLLDSCMVWGVLASSLFFLPFHFLGFVNLTLGYPVVGPGYACGVVGALLMALLVWEQISLGSREGKQHFFPAFRSMKPAMTVRTLMLGVFAAGVLFLGFVRITGYPIRLEGLAYHLPIGVHIFQSGSLEIWDPAFMHTYPANQSVYLGFLLGFLPERLVSAANFPFLMGLAAALFGLSRAVTRDQNAISLATVGIVTMPIVVRASETIESDISALAFLAVAAYFVLAAPGGARRRYLLAGLAAGLAFGFKSVHLVGFLVLACFIAAREYRGIAEGSHVRNGDKLRRMAWSLILFSMASFGVASFWLVRNYVQFGNPLYPVFIPHIFPILGWTEALDASIIGNLTTQLAYVDSGWEWLLYPWRERAQLNLGPFFALAAPVSTLLAGWYVLRNRVTNRLTLVSMLLGGFTITFIWWMLGDRQPRYNMGALVFMGPVIAWTLSRLDGRARRFYNAMTVAAIVLAFSISLFPTGLDLVRRTMLTDQSQRHIFYQYPEVIDELPAGSVVVNLGFDHEIAGNHRTRAWNYPLFGKHLTNHVVSFNEAARLFSADPYETQDAPSYRLSVGGLRAINATHLFMIGETNLTLETGLSLIERGRLVENPVMRTPLAEERVVYEIRYLN